MTGSSAAHHGNCRARPCNHTFVADSSEKRDDFSIARKFSDECFHLIRHERVGASSTGFRYCFWKSGSWRLPARRIRIGSSADPQVPPLDSGTTLHSLVKRLGIARPTKVDISTLCR